MTPYGLSTITSVRTLVFLELVNCMPTWRPMPPRCCAPIGIARDDLARLFKPLTQPDAGLPRRHGGVGLGLALAPRLAELHGGTLEVESESGKGCTCALRLPVGVCWT